MISILKKFGFYLKNKKKIYLIESEENEEFVKESLQKEKYIGLDTEFNWRNTYFPELSLLQISTSSKILLIDCLKFNPHPSHFNLEKSLLMIKEFKPKKAILTNLSPVLDYVELKKILPKNVVPAHDGLLLKL